MKPQTGCNAVARLFLGLCPVRLRLRLSMSCTSCPVKRLTLVSSLRSEQLSSHRMCTIMRQDPLQDAIILQDKVLSEDLLTLPEDDQRLVEKELPLRPEATINKINDLNDDVFTAPTPASRITSASSAASVGRMSRPASTQAPQQTPLLVPRDPPQPLRPLTP